MMVFLLYLALLFRGVITMLLIDLIRWKMNHHSFIDFFITDAHCSFQADNYDDCDYYDEYDETEYDYYSE